MALETKPLERKFRYNSVDLPDPGAQYMPDEVRGLYAATYPEIVNAAIEGPEEKDGALVYTFRRAVGTKGCGGVMNYLSTRGGRVVALCEFCGRRSRSSKPDADGEPELWEIGRGWSEAPYPHNFVHGDGSVGSRWSCPACNRRLNSGETLTQRDGLHKAALV